MNNQKIIKIINYRNNQNHYILLDICLKMNCMRKFQPVALRLMQLFVNKGIRKKPVFQASLIHRYTFMTITSLAFIWPLKKTSKAAQGNVVDKIPAILENADRLFDNGHYEECYQVLLESEDQINVELQWRIVRVLYNMSKEPKYEQAYKKDLIFMAYEIISKLIDKPDKHYAIHKYYALLLDAKSTHDGIKERIRQLENVKKHLDLAVTLNPDDATCLHMLGEWCYQIAEMPWHQRKIAEVLFASPPHSTHEDALEYFLRAEAVQPRFYSVNLLRLGNCYLKLGKEDQAKYYLKLAASYPAKSNDDHSANKEAAELLKKMM